MPIAAATEAKDLVSPKIAQQKDDSEKFKPEIPALKV